MRLLGFLGVFCTALVAGSFSAQAQLVDCGSVGGWQGAIICSDTELSIKHKELMSLLEKEHVAPDSPFQKQWFDSLTDCRDPSVGADLKNCMLGRYSKQIEKVSRELAQRPAPEPKLAPQKVHNSAPAPAPQDGVYPNQGVEPIDFDKLSQEQQKQVEPQPKLHSQPKITAPDADDMYFLEKTDADLPADPDFPTNLASSMNPDAKSYEREEQRAMNQSQAYGQNAPRTDATHEARPKSNVKPAQSHVAGLPGFVALYGSCQSGAQSPAETSRCLDGAVENADSTLQVISSRIEVDMYGADGAGVSNDNGIGFYDNVLAFRKYRDSYCGWVGYLFSGSLTKGDMYKACYARMTLERAKELMQITGYPVPGEAK